MKTGYLKTTIKGLSWTAVLRLGARLINLGKTAILARLLLPAQFGAFGVAAIAISLLEILTETGINIFLLQERGFWQRYINTAWVVSIFRGIAISVLVFATADLVAGFFHIPDAAYLLTLAAVVPFVRGFINPSVIRLQKNLQFSREFAYRMTILLVEVLVAVSLAFMLHSPEALVYSMIVSAVVEVLLSFVFITPRPTFSFDLKQAKLIISRGKWVTGFGIFDFIFSNGDNIIVGRLLGAAPLGIYQNAYKLSTLPVQEINDVFFKVTLPIYVKLAGEKQRLRVAMLKHFVTVNSLMLVAGIGMFVFARQLVAILLGPNWSEAVEVVRVLAFLGVAKGLTSSFNSLFLALKQQRYVTLVTFVSVSVMLLSIIPAVQTWGIVGAAGAATLGALAALPVGLFFIWQLIRGYDSA